MDRECVNGVEVMGSEMESVTCGTLDTFLCGRPTTTLEFHCVDHNSVPFPSRLCRCVLIPKQDVNGQQYVDAVL